jgi:DNA-directed RNA polymerase specialized sigma24 family protein
VLAADDDSDDSHDSDDYDGLSDEEYEAFVREEEELLATAGAGEGESEQVGPTEDELNQVVRAVDEDAEHFEMRRHLLASADEPDRTVLRYWTFAATEVSQMVGISGDAVRQRKTRLRRLIDAELGRPGQLPATNTPG